MVIDQENLKINDLIFKLDQLYPVPLIEQIRNLSFFFPMNFDVSCHKLTNKLFEKQLAFVSIWITIIAFIIKKINKYMILSLKEL